MYLANSRKFDSRTKLARTCLSVTSILVQVVVLSVVSNFVRLLILEILAYARDTDEGFALVARFLHDSRFVERSAAEFAQEHPSAEKRRRTRVCHVGHIHMVACDSKGLD